MSYLYKRVNEGMSNRFCRRFVRNETEERTFPDKVCLKVKGQIVELTEATWSSQNIVSILQDMGLSFTRAYGYGFYCSDPNCYRFLCKALNRDDKAQKAVAAGKPITKASFINALDVVAYFMNDALKKGDADIKIGESRKLRFESTNFGEELYNETTKDLSAFEDHVQKRFVEICKTEYHYKRVSAHVVVEDGLETNDGNQMLCFYLFSRKGLNRYMTYGDSRDSISEVCYSFKSDGFYEDDEYFCGTTEKDLIEAVAEKLASDLDSSEY